MRGVLNRRGWCRPQFLSFARRGLSTPPPYRGETFLKHASQAALVAIVVGATGLFYNERQGRMTAESRQLAQQQAEIVSTREFAKKRAFAVLESPALGPKFPHGGTYVLREEESKLTAKFGEKKDEMLEQVVVILGGHGVGKSTMIRRHFQGVNGAVHIKLRTQKEDSPPLDEQVLEALNIDVTQRLGGAVDVFLTEVFDEFRKKHGRPVFLLLHIERKEIRKSRFADVCNMAKNYARDLKICNIVIDFSPYKYCPTSDAAQQVVELREFSRVEAHQFLHGRKIMAITGGNAYDQHGSKHREVDELLSWAGHNPDILISLTSQSAEELKQVKRHRHNSALLYISDFSGRFSTKSGKISVQEFMETKMAKDSDYPGDLRVSEFEEATGISRYELDDEIQACINRDAGMKVLRLNAQKTRVSFFNWQTYRACGGTSNK